MTKQDKVLDLVSDNGKAMVTVNHSDHQALKILTWIFSPPISNPQYSHQVPLWLGDGTWAETYVKLTRPCWRCQEGCSYWPYPEEGIHHSSSRDWVYSLNLPGGAMPGWGPTPWKLAERRWYTGGHFTHTPIHVSLCVCTYIRSSYMDIIYDLFICFGGKKLRRTYI